MVHVEGKDYNSCLVDTCVWSEFDEDRQLFESFKKLLVDEECAVCLSIYTAHELLRIDRKYQALLKYLRNNSAFLIKPLKMLLEDELECYPEENYKSVVYVSSPRLPSLLEYIVSSQEYIAHSDSISQRKESVIDSIVRLKSNFPPDKDERYADNRVIEFVCRVAIQQLETINPEWLNSWKGTSIVVDRIKSLSSQLLITFWKFYLMEDRSPRKSDAVDIAMSSALEYVDFFITEKNLANDIRQIQRKGLSFDNLKVMTISDLKNNYS